MIDPLLYSVRDYVRNAGWGYGYAEIEIMDAGNPPPRCGDIFIAVHELPASQKMMNARDDYYSFALTLTMRVTNVPLDRVGDQLEARNVAQKIGFNARANQLSLVGTPVTNWNIIFAANDLLVTLNPDQTIIYGFCEPAWYRGMEKPALVGGSWFRADPDATDIGLKAELRFMDARRIQPIGIFC